MRLVILYILYSFVIVAGLGLIVKPQLALKGKKDVKQEDIASEHVRFRTSGYCFLVVGLMLLISEIFWT